MSRSAASGLLKIVVVVALLACAFALPARGEAAVRVLAADTLESRLVYRINLYRASHGLRKLRPVPALKRAGTRHAENMGNKGYFSHSWSTGASFGSWIRWYFPGPGYRSWTAGENLFWAAPDATARRVMRAWRNSPAHHANLLRPGWREVGVGAVRVRGPRGTYSGFGTVTIVAAEFGARS